MVLLQLEFVRSICIGAFFQACTTLDESSLFSCSFVHRGQATTTHTHTRTWCTRKGREVRSGISVSLSLASFLHKVDFVTLLCYSHEVLETTTYRAFPLNF